MNIGQHILSKAPCHIFRRLQLEHNQAFTHDKVFIYNVSFNYLVERRPYALVSSWRSANQNRHVYHIERIYHRYRQSRRNMPAFSGFDLAPGPA